MILRLAWRNIWRNKMRSMVIIASVTAGLFAGMAIMALYKGMMKSRIRTVIDTETGHVQLHAKGFMGDLDPKLFIQGDEKMIAFLSGDKSIKAIAQRTITAGMVSTPNGSSGVSIIGISPVEETNVSGLGKKMREGKMDWPPKTKGILMGKKLAKKLKLSLGEKVVITMTDTADNLISSAYRIKGIYQSANAPMDEVNVYISRKDLQDMLGLGNQVHEIAIVLHNDTMLNRSTKQLAHRFPSLVVESWKELSPETSLMAETVDTLSYIILVIILVALSFGIMNTMMMSILERRHEIGMMMALGMGKFPLLMLIMTETFFLTITGIPIALAIGTTVIDHYATKGMDLSGMGKEMMESFGFETMIYPDFPSDKIGFIILLVLGTALVSSIVPILKSLRMDPVSALQK
jgi:ABC-type lipoprotein release transport system permease subunit